MHVSKGDEAKQTPDLRFVVNQHTMIGIAEYVPIVARKSAPYCRWTLSCTTSRMMKPVRAMAIVGRMKTKRLRNRSEKVAVIIAIANAHAQGRTDSSCVWIALKP